MTIESWVFNSILVYYFLINVSYLVLLVAAVLAIKKDMAVRPLIERLRDRYPAFAPSISILAPAYNEELTIIDSTQSFLSLNYPHYEVIVINDGSKDGTMQKLIEAFGLKFEFFPYDDSLSTTDIVNTYKSEIHPNLIVIDKVNGGKADALNVGIGFANYDIFCAVDSDSLLEVDALLKVASPFLERPEETIASGGTVRIANGAKVNFGRVEEIRLPNNFFLLMQIVEYTRAFLCGRIGWNYFNSTLIISGAFGLFSKKAVRKVGGYTAGSIGEDMELIIRLHRYYRERKLKYSIVFIPDPVCWTEAPSTFAPLQKQRDRWQRGLADTLFMHRKVIFNPTYGFIGMFTFPYFVLVELLGPVVEVISVLSIIVLSMYGLLSAQMFWLFLLAGVFYGAIISISALMIEEIYFSKYGKIRQFLLLFVVTIVESFGYRQMTSFWRLRGLYNYLRGDKSWGHLKRAGFHS